MPLTVISHFYNEELLLPYWLTHHLALFDHGILIDYDSTDSSIAIIKELAPNWEVRRSRNREFNAEEVDKEVIDIEKGTEGWKVCLNITEFYVYHDLRDYVRKFEILNPGIGMFRPLPYEVYESIETFNTPLTNKPLIFQRHFGSFENRQNRRRSMHCYDHGRYDVGRHFSYIEHKVVDDVFLMWFGWAPYPQVCKRKLQIQYRIPPEHIKKGMGFHHATPKESLDNTVQQNLNTSKDLFILNEQLGKEAELLRLVLPKLNKDFANGNFSNRSKLLHW